MGMCRKTQWILIAGLRGAEGEGGRKGKGGGEKQTLKKTQNQYGIGGRKGKRRKGSRRKRTGRSAATATTTRTTANTTPGLSSNLFYLSTYLRKFLAVGTFAVHGVGRRRRILGFLSKTPSRSSTRHGTRRCHSLLFGRSQSGIRPPGNS